MVNKNGKPPGDYMAVVGRRLRSIRQSFGWSLVEASEKTGLSPVAISSWERADRNPSIDQLGRLAAGYGVTVATLLPEAAATPTVLPAEQIAASLQAIALTVVELASSVESIRQSLEIMDAEAGS